MRLSTGLYSDPLGSYSAPQILYPLQGGGEGEKVKGRVGNRQGEGEGRKGVERNGKRMGEMGRGGRKRKRG